MANFAINCSDEIIERGNKLIAKMSEGTDEKKGETLNRMFALVEKSMDDIVMQSNGVDTKGLDAALSDIRKMFESVSSSRERLLGEKDQQITQLQAEKSALKVTYEGQLAVKERRVKDVMVRIGGCEESLVRPITGASRPWNYRNKMAVPVSQVTSGPVLG